MEDGTAFCTNCGAPLDRKPVQQQYIQQPVQQPAPAYQYYAQPQPVEHKSSAIAICAFIFSFIIAPVGLILGIIGLVKKNAGTKGLSVAAVIIGAIGTLSTLLFSSILVPSMLGYVNKSKQAAANSAAAEVRHCVTGFLTEADANGFGMKRGAVQEFDITVNGRMWTVSAADPENFFSDGDNAWGSFRWGEGASGTYDDVVKKPPTGENLLLLTLADELPDLDIGSIHIAVYDGECTACAFCADKSGTLSANTEYPVIGSDGRFNSPGSWQTSYRGKYNIGLSPVSDH